MAPVRRLLVTTLALAVLTGCGGDPYDDYCDAVKSHRDELTKTLDVGGPRALLESLPTFEELRDRAPGDIEDDWAVVTQALAELKEALEAAGVDPASYDAEKPPSDVTQAERDRIAAAATAVGDEQTRAALAAVDQQARDVCHAPLTL